MTVKLELMEIVWLQNIKRKPGEYVLLNAEDILTELLRFGLIEYKKIDGETGLFITKAGDEIIRQHLPIASFYDRRQYVFSYETRGGEIKKIKY